MKVECNRILSTLTVVLIGFFAVINCTSEVNADHPVIFKISGAIPMTNSGTKERSEINIYKDKTLHGEKLSFNEFQELMAFIKNNPDFESIPKNPRTFSARTGSEVFYFVKQNGLEKTVVGLVYGKDSKMLPKVFWSADVVYHRERKKSYAVLARSQSTFLTLAIYDPNQTTQDYLGKTNGIIEFDRIKLNTWPKPLIPLSEIQTLVQSYNICGINRIEILPGPNYLLISLHNDHADCDPIYVRFDLDTKEWFWLTLEAKPIEPFH